MAMRQASAGKYRYGFNGKENDNEVKGIGNQQDYGERIYDNRLGRFLSLDPLQKEYPWFTPYQFAGNSPIANIDLDGLENYSYHLARSKNSNGDPVLRITYDGEEEMGFFEFLGDINTGGTGQAHILNYGGQTIAVFSSLHEMKVITHGKTISQIKKIGETIQNDRMAAATMMQQTLEEGVQASNEQLRNTSAPGRQVLEETTPLKSQTAKSPTSSSNNQTTRANSGNPNAITSNTAGITLKKTEPNQAGPGYKLSVNSTTVSEGKINVVGRPITTGSFDFVVTNEGKLLVGTGHHTLSGGAKTVKAAGQLKIVNGKVRLINNSSGHYLPTVEEGEGAVNILRNLGVDVKGSRLELYKLEKDATGKEKAKLAKTTTVQ